MLGKMLSERTCITISYHFGYFLNGIPVLHNKGGSLAHPYTPNHINSSQFATLLYFSIKGRLTHIQLLRQHFYIKVLIRQISFYDMNNLLYKIIRSIIPIRFRFTFLLLQHQRLCIYPLQAFPLEYQVPDFCLQYLRIEGFHHIIIHTYF